MFEKFEEIRTSPAAWWILSAFTIGSVIFGAYSHFKGKKKRELSVQESSYQVIENKKNKIEKLSFTYDNEAIDDLTITKYAIWNSGNVELRFEDIASGRPLTIRSKDGVEILDASIIENTDGDNGFAIQQFCKNRIDLEFEYINEKNGIVVQIIHTGNSDGLWVDCKIKGGKEINRNLEYGDRTDKLLQLFSISSFIIDMLCLIGIFIGYKTNQPDDTFRILAIIMGITFGITNIISCFVEIYRGYNLGIPKVLRKYL